MQIRPLATLATTLALPFISLTNAFAPTNKPSGRSLDRRPINPGATATKANQRLPFCNPRLATTALFATDDKGSESDIPTRTFKLGNGEFSREVEFPKAALQLICSAIRDVGNANTEVKKTDGQFVVNASIDPLDEESIICMTVSIIIPNDDGTQRTDFLVATGMWPTEQEKFFRDVSSGDPGNYWIAYFP